MEDVSFLNKLLSASLFVFGLVIFLNVTFPPIHLINDPKQKEKEKKLLHIINMNHLKTKDKFKVIGKLLLGMLLIVLSILPVTGDSLMKF